MTQGNRKNRFSGAADAICRSRFSPYLFSFTLSALGLWIVFLLARDSLSFLYETKAAGWYGLLRSLGRKNAIAAFSEGEDLAFLSFAFNPLNRLISLFPFSSLPAGICFVNAIRCGLCAAAFTCFLKMRKTADTSAVLFSVLYALSSYAIVSQLTGVAADGLIVLPLLLTGIERIVLRRGFALFSVSLAVSAVVSFGTTFGFFVFSLLWLSVSRFSRPGVRLKTVGFDFLLVLLSVPAAFLLSAPVLLPSFDRLVLSFTDLSFTQSYNLIDFFGKMLPATYDGLIDNRFPYLFIGMIPLLLLPIFFLCKKISVREKIAFGVLLFFLYFTFSVNVLSAFWDLFAPLNGYRYALAILFPVLFLTMSARAYEQMDHRSERTLAAVALILAALISVLQRLDLSYETAEGARVVWFSEINSVWVPLPFLALGCAGLLSVIRAREPNRGRSPRLLSLLSLLLMLITTFDAAVSGAALAGVIAKKEGDDVSETEGNHAYTSAYYAAYESGIDACEIKDPLYRAEKFDAKTDRDAAYLGYSSAASLPTDILSAFGIGFNEDGTLGKVSSPLSLSLFGVRYVMTHTPIETKIKQKKRLRPTTSATEPTYDAPGELPDSLAAFFDPVYSDDAGTVYENAYALPILFRAAAIPDGSVLTETNATPYSRVNSVFRTLTRDPLLSLYVPADCTLSATPYCSPVASEHVGYFGYERNSSNGVASLQYTVTVGQDGPLFCSFPTEYPITAAKIRLNGKDIGVAYTENESDVPDENGEPIRTVAPNACFLGNFTAGETVRVEFSFGSGNDGTVCYLPEDVPFIYEIDRAATERAFTLLSSGFDSLSSRGERLEAELSAGTNLPAVVTTLPPSTAKLRGAENAAFLGYFAAGTSDGAGKAAVSPVLADPPVYLLSLSGCIILFVLLFCESLVKRGARIPFFTRAAGGSTEETEE